MVSTPEVSGDFVFIGSCAGMFYALDRGTGKVRWSHDVHQEGKVGFHGDSLVAGDLVIIGTDVKDQPSRTGYVYAFEKTSGEVKWKTPTGRGIASDIIRLGSSVYGVTLNDEVFSIDLYTGLVNWSFSTKPGREDLVPSAPTAVGGLIFFGDRDGGLYGLEARTGKIVWKRELGIPISTSLVASGSNIYFGGANHIYSVDSKTGAIKTDFLADAWSFGRPTIVNDSILFFLGDTLTAFDISLKKMRWRQKTNGRWRTPRIHIWRETVLVGNELGRVFAFRIRDGNQHWSGEFNGIIRSINSVNDILYIGTREGIVYSCKVDGEKH